VHNLVSTCSVILTCSLVVTTYILNQCLVDSAYKLKQNSLEFKHVPLELLKIKQVHKCMIFNVQTDLDHVYLNE